MKIASKKYLDKIHEYAEIHGTFNVRLLNNRILLTKNIKRGSYELWKFNVQNNFFSEHLVPCHTIYQNM